MSWWNCCIKSDEIKRNNTTVLDLSHSTLVDVPNEIFNYERTLEELYLNSNRIYDLPRQLFLCSSLKILNAGDNDLTRLPTAIQDLKSLQHLDLSRNALIALPDLSQLHQLQILNLNLNPLEKIPDVIFSASNLTELYLNDTNLTFIVANIGKLVNLTILEVRENKLVNLPESLSRLKRLKRLDVGQNELTTLPSSLSQLENLTELSLDLNDLEYLPENILNLSKLIHLDCSFNNISNQEDKSKKNVEINQYDIHETDIKTVDTVFLESHLKDNTSYGDSGGTEQYKYSDEANHCSGPNLEFSNTVQTLYLSNNNLAHVPNMIFHMKYITTLRLEGNFLTNISSQISCLINLEELILTGNNLTSLPGSIGWLKCLRVLMLDDNLLENLPRELSSCLGLTILSVRNNKLTHLMPDLGHLQHLTVLNIVNNRIRHLPVDVLNLEHIKAIWISETQSQPLVPLQREFNGQEIVLTCVLLPQIDGGFDRIITAEYQKNYDTYSPSGEHVPSTKRINFAVEQPMPNNDKQTNQKQANKLNRSPTPYPKQLKQMAKNLKAGNKYQQQNSEIKQAKIITPSDSANIDKFDSVVVYEQNLVIREAKNTKATNLLDKNYGYSDTNKHINIYSEEMYDQSLMLPNAAHNGVHNDINNLINGNDYNSSAITIYPEQLYGQTNVKFLNRPPLTRDDSQISDVVDHTQNMDDSDQQRIQSRISDTHQISFDQMSMSVASIEPLYSQSTQRYHHQSVKAEDLYAEANKSHVSKDGFYDKSATCSVISNGSANLYNIDSNFPPAPYPKDYQVYGQVSKLQNSSPPKRYLPEPLYGKTSTTSTISSPCATVYKHANSSENLYSETKISLPNQPPPYEIAKNFSKNAKYFNQVTNSPTSPRSPTYSNSLAGINNSGNYVNIQTISSMNRNVNETPSFDTVDNKFDCIQNFIDNSRTVIQESDLIKPKAQKISPTSSSDIENNTSKNHYNQIQKEQSFEMETTELLHKFRESVPSNITKSKIPLSPNLHKKLSQQRSESPKTSTRASSLQVASADKQRDADLNFSDLADDVIKKTKIPQIKKNWVFGQHKNVKVVECTINQINFTVEERINQGFFVSAVSECCPLIVGDKILQINEESISLILNKTRIENRGDILNQVLQNTSLPLNVLISRLI